MKMISLRLNIILKILSAPRPEIIKQIIAHELDEDLLTNDRTVNFKQLLENLKSDILFQLMSKHNHEHFKNLKEALAVLQTYDGTSETAE